MIIIKYLLSDYISSKVGLHCELKVKKINLEYLLNTDRVIDSSCVCDVSVTSKDTIKIFLINPQGHEDGRRKEQKFKRVKNKSCDWILRNLLK